MAAFLEVFSESFPQTFGLELLPEITVTHDATPITDGETTPIDFGFVVEGGSSLSETFVITNDGEADLVISSITLPSGYSFNGSTQIGSGGGTITEGNSVNLIVDIATGTPGTYSGDITINSNDSDEAVFNFAVTGEILEEQELEVSYNGSEIVDGETTPVDFGSTIQDETAPTKTFVLNNLGETTLNISGITLPDGYDFDASSDLDGTADTISAGSSKNLIVKLNTDTVGTFSGDIVISSDDTDEGTYNFAITGIITAPQLSSGISYSEFLKAELGLGFD